MEPGRRIIRNSPGINIVEQAGPFSPARLLISRLSHEQPLGSGEK